LANITVKPREGGGSGMVEEAGGGSGRMEEADGGSGRMEEAANLESERSAARMTTVI
jgi:hypothetical protein